MAGNSGTICPWGLLLGMDQVWRHCPVLGQGVAYDAC
ncbi:hypothetical protein AK812_SmicGene48305, partial [Symbiodinium microadriaticum]